MNSIINDEYSYNNTEKEEEEYDYYDNSTSDRNFYNTFKEMKKKNKFINKFEEKEKTLKQFNKDLLNLSSILEKKKKQLNNRENKVKRQELKIKSVLSEFDRIVNEDRMWKKDIENLRKDYQSSIDILNRENKRLLDSIHELSNTEEELKLEIKQKNLEIEELKFQNENINNEKNEIQKITNELKDEIIVLKEKIKDMQNENSELHENYEKLARKKKENIKKDVEVSVKPEYHSIEIQTENSNILEKIINQQYMDIKKLFSIFHYILTLYNKNNMEDSEYCILWNDIRTKFFKNKELKDIKIFNFISYVLNYSLKKENLINIFESQSDHFVKLYLEFVLDYMNENSLSVEQKLKIATIILKCGTIKPNNANSSTTSNTIVSTSDKISEPSSPYHNLKNSSSILDIPLAKLKKLSLLTSMVSFDLNYEKDSHIYIYLYLISLYSYMDTVETKEDFISILSEYADNISYLLIFIFNGLINELTTSEKRILFINNYGVSLLLNYLNSYNKYYIYLSSIILVELFSDNKCQAILLKKFYNNKFFDLCSKILNYNNINISENICITLQKISSFSEDNTLLYNNQGLMKTLENLLNRSGYTYSINNNNNNNEILSSTNTNLHRTDENLGVLPDYEFLALNILSIFKKRQQK